MHSLKAVQIQLFALAAIGVACGPASAQERMKVGEKYALHVDSGGSSDVERIPTAMGEVYTISHRGATYIAIHFKKFHLAPGDSLIVSDADGGQTYVLESKGKMNAGKFWSQHVKGDTIVLELVGAAQQPGKGFVIDEYAAGFVSLDPVTRRICGVNDFENAICRAPSIEYDRAQSVARLLIQGRFLCTGWLVSANDHFITNEHCITSSAEALNTDYEFGSEAPSCGSANCQLCYPGTIYSGASFIQDNPGLDYALIQLAGSPSATWGFLQIDNRQAVLGEQIYLVSHPIGRAKEFAYNSSEDASGFGTVLSVTEPTCSGGTLEVGYWNDTEGGSSGSPVLAVSSQKVIALHHCHNFCDQGGAPNRGVPIDQICTEICGFLGPDCTVNADCEDADPCTADACVGGTCEHTPQANCCGNAVCELGEDCSNCPSDCFSGSSAVCGNNVCETADGEDCVSCPDDCNSKLVGQPSSRYCCGDGSAQNGVTCGDARCIGSGNTCTADPGVASCCGDLVCEGSEDTANCEVDCPDLCGNGTCDAGEDQCNCATDCGTPPSNEGNCTDGIDNDCDGATDCNDGDCTNDPACACGGNKAPCQNNSDCCSGNCKNGSCRGN